MIRSLRRRHVAIVVVISAILPVLFIAGLLVRRSVPVMKSVPSRLIETGGHTGEP
jgi:hypothetical protein